MTNVNASSNANTIFGRLRNFLSEDSIIERTRDCQRYFQLVRPAFARKSNWKGESGFPLAMAIKVG